MKALKKEVNPKRGRPAEGDEKRTGYEEVRNNVKNIKNARYVLDEALEHLTEKQAANLELIEAENMKLFRAYQLKERLRILLKLRNPDDVLVELIRWLSSAAHSRITEIVELGRKIRRHKDYILYFITTSISNARVEVTNNKISQLFLQHVRKAISSF